jgi:uncharacterized protein (DUF58 family)
MIRRATPKLGAYVALSALGLFCGLLLGRPELVALAAPFAVLALLGLGTTREPRFVVTSSLGRESAVVGETVVLTVSVTAPDPVDCVEVLAVAPPGLDPSRDLANPRTIALAPGEAETLEIPLRCTRFGAHALGTLYLRTRDRLGLYVFEQAYELRGRLKVFPPAAHLRAIVQPLQTQALTGNEVSRAKGDGIEFADIRPFVPGDRVRRINWRASARRGTLHVSERHPERNTDVVLFLDSFAEARLGSTGTLEFGVRAVAALAARYLARRDRVALVAFGGVLRWLLPGMGDRQLYRILDALLDTEIAVSYAWKGIEVVPARTLPPGALVLAVSPLLDDRAISALVDLRSRGFDVAIVEVSPLAFVPPASGREQELARRLWRLRRNALRDRYRRLGVPVVEWLDDRPLESVIEEVRTYRRHARLARA